MADKKIDLAALAQSMDTTFTRSSASSGPAFETHSIKAGFSPGEKLKIKVIYTCIVNMVRDRDIQESKAQYEKEGDSYIAAATKQIVKDYRELVTGEPEDVDLTDEVAEQDPKNSVKLKRVDVGTTVEIVDLNIHNNKRTALFRRIAFFEVN